MRAQLACCFFLALCLIACGGRAAATDTDAGPDHGLCAPAGSMPSPDFDAECKGKMACTELPMPTCRCACVLCENERCLGAICDDGMGGPCWPRQDQGVDNTPDIGPKVDVGNRDVEVNCAIPSYPSDCAQVSMFDCGFMAVCNGSQVTANWHAHVLCGEQEQIVSFTCTTTCPNGCQDVNSWPQNGTQLIQEHCLP